MSSWNERIIELSLADAVHALHVGETTSVQLTQEYLARINARDASLSSVITLNPAAMDEARTADENRNVGGMCCALAGVPILIKDNIDVARMATTAGSFALADNIAAQDAPLVHRLRTAGAVILGKTNLSEWANFRSGRSVSGWSAVGGLTRNPYALDRSAGGSSSGSCVAVAASFASGSIGTETDGSIVWPAAANGLVGLKPTLGLVSRTGIVPISAWQDTPGPIARTVIDVAMMLNVIAGSDPADPATARADVWKTDYANEAAVPLRGIKLGALRFSSFKPETTALYDAALDVLRERGAEIADIHEFPHQTLMENRITALLHEFKVSLNAYLGQRGANVKCRSLSDVIAFNAADPRESNQFGQDLLEAAGATQGLQAPAYLFARHVRGLAGREGIDRILRENELAALVAPTNDPALPVDLINGDSPAPPTSTLPATAGYPHLTVPMGQVTGLPVGLSFIGEAWSEARLLRLAYAFEQVTHARRPPNI